MTDRRPLGFFNMPEILDNWTVGQAWEHVYGDRAKPSPEGIDESSLCELDAVIASYFGEETTEGRRKAAAALLYIVPRILCSQCPPAPDHDQRARLASAVVDCVDGYRKDALGVDATTASDVARIAVAMSEWDLSILTAHHWYVIWDAMGISGLNKKNQLFWDFYRFADKQVFFSGLE